MGGANSKRQDGELRRIAAPSPDLDLPTHFDHLFADGREAGCCTHSLAEFSPDVGGELSPWCLKTLSNNFVVLRDEGSLGKGT